MKQDGEGQRYIVVGHISGLFGVKGWVKVYSHTDPRDNVLSYAPWLLRRDGVWEPRKLVAGKVHGKGVVALLEGCSDRDEAAALVGSEIAITRDQLPQVEDGEYYWADLVGLAVRTVDGTELGRVEQLFETGANDVLVVKGERERLIPFLLEQVVKEVDLEGGRITVDWDPDF